MNPLLDLAARPIIAHRGASGHAPENTLAAFQLAIEEGAEAIELDVRISADGVPVVLHDPTLDRTTDLAGPVALRPLAELRRADAGARFSADGGRTFPWRGRGIGIPTLGEVLETFPDLALLIEIKEPEAQHAVRQLLLGRGAAGRCLVASELAAALDAFQEPPFLVGASRPDIAGLWLRAALRLPLKPVRYRALSVPERYRGLTVATGAFVRAARRLGCPVHVWTVNDPGRARRLWATGVAGILTDFPGVIREARDAAGFAA